MEAAAPAQLSGLAKLLLRRPPSLRELVTLVGYADDYTWFAGLVRRLFPEEAEAALSAPDVRTRVELFANLFGERHFPLYAPFIEFWRSPTLVARVCADCGSGGASVSGIGIRS